RWGAPDGSVLDTTLLMKQVAVLRTVHYKSGAEEESAGMSDFQLDEDELRQRLQRAAMRAQSGDVAQVIAAARRGAGLAADDIALLWATPSLDTEVMYQLAREIRGQRPLPLETFSPLYMTNTCDAECRMCGMRRDNQALHRETAEMVEVENQLHL